MRSLGGQGFLCTDAKKIQFGMKVKTLYVLRICDRWGGDFGVSPQVQVRQSWELAMAPECVFKAGVRFRAYPTQALMDVYTSKKKRGG